MINLSLCFISFIFMVGLIFCVGYFILFIESDLFSLMSSSVMTLFDLMSLVFMGFVFSYTEDGDLNIVSFILLVFMFVMLMVFIISPKKVSILLGWDGLDLVSYSLVV